MAGAAGGPIASVSRTLTLLLVALVEVSWAQNFAAQPPETAEAPVRRLQPPRPRPPAGARLVTKDRLPLRTESRFVVDKLGERVKLACVNWYGAESNTYVAGGLEVREIHKIVERIVELGFNCVRLPYSLEAHMRNPPISDEFLAANLNLHGGRFLDLFDAVITKLSEANLMIIVDNHVSRAGWCCHWSQDEGLWYAAYSEELWIDSLVNMTRRYRSNPYVVAIDLRNEVHDKHGEDPRMLTWGEGDALTDWGAAATRAGNRVLAANPDVLVVVMSLCFGMELRPIRTHPIRLDLPNRVIYQTHNYIEYQFWNLLQRNFITFARIRQITATVALSLVAVLAATVCAWRKAGRPAPSRGLFLFSLGAWVCGLGLALAPVAYRGFVAGCVYCRWGALIDVLPWTYWCLAAAGGGLLLALWAWFRCPWPEDEDAQEMETYALAEDDCEHEESGWEGRGADSPARDFLAFVSAPMQGRWGSSHTIVLQCVIGSTFLLLFSTLLFVAATIIDTYSFNERWIDHMWGFALEEGQPWTAPVIMGEFGYMNHGVYWFTFMRYLSARDVDFAYWAINGRKYAEGFISPDGAWHQYPQPKWVNETFGLLEEDYLTVKLAWRLRDLQALMESPSRWVPRDIGCVQDVLGNFCDDEGRQFGDIAFHPPGRE